MAKLIVKESEDKEPFGLEDGGHTYLSCSNCRRKLIDVWVTNPNAIDPKTGKLFEWNLQAKCCYCGDKSYVISVKGRFHLAGYGTVKPDDPEQDIPQTLPGEIVEENDKFIINTVRA